MPLPFMFYSFLLLIFISSNTVLAQDIFIDSRDNIEYPLIEVAGKTWFATDLKYISPKAHFQDIDSLKTRGNFYYWEESTKVCPDGWKLTSKEDWSIFLLALIHKITLKTPHEFSKIEAFEYNNLDKLSAVMPPHFSFWGLNTPLNINPTGRIEDGKTDYGNQFIDYWATASNKKHPYYHIHLTATILAGHSHKHHISPNSKKRRMFKVRCVKEKKYKKD